MRITLGGLHLRVPKDVLNLVQSTSRVDEQADFAWTAGALAANATIVGTANGANTIDASSMAAGKAVTISVGAGKAGVANTLKGGAAADTITGGASNDTITTGGGLDTADSSRMAGQYAGLWGRQGLPPDEQRGHQSGPLHGRAADETHGITRRAQG